LVITYASPCNFSTCLRLTSSQMANPMAFFSLLACDLDKTFCFLLFQDIKLSPNNYAIPISRSCINRWSCPISIRMSNNLSHFIPMSCTRWIVYLAQQLQKRFMSGMHKDWLFSNVVSPTESGPSFGKVWLLKGETYKLICSIADKECNVYFPDATIYC
jgi:hypothetical protein